jgi:hypothetical protein
VELDLATIRSRFDAVRSGEITREDASDWARIARETHDRRDLRVVPESDWKVIWNALEFLEMYDMKISPTEYMYAEEDLVAHRP